MKIFVLDTGDAFTTDRFNTCFIVQDSKGTNLAIECPHPYMKILEQNSSSKFPEVDKINHVFVSHLHADHFGGLETFAFYKKFIEDKKLTLYVGEDDLKYAKTALKPAMGTMFDGKEYSDVPFEFYFHEVPMQQKSMRGLGNLIISVKKTNHYIPSHAIMIRENDVSIAYSSDTIFDKELIDWMDQADIIIHEVGSPPGHASYKDLCSLPEKTRDKIKLIHYSDTFDGRIFPCLKSGQIIERVWKIL